MNSLERMVLSEGEVLPNNVLRVDGFINHQILPDLMEEIAEDFYQYFKDRQVDKILTIEASGIAFAVLLAQKFGVPMLFAKKTTPSTLKEDNIYSSMVHSYTKNVTNRIVVSKEYLHKGEKVLIIDDFLANGEAAMGLVDLVNQAGGEVVGIGICIEKSYQAGRKRLDDMGLDVCSLCRIASLENEEITLVED